MASVPPPPLLNDPHKRRHPDPLLEKRHWSLHPDPLLHWSHRFQLLDHPQTALMPCSSQQIRLDAAHILGGLLLHLGEDRSAEAPEINRCDISFRIKNIFFPITNCGQISRMGKWKSYEMGTLFQTSIISWIFSGETPIWRSTWSTVDLCSSRFSALESSTCCTNFNYAEGIMFYGFLRVFKEITGIKSKQTIIEGAKNSLDNTSLKQKFENKNSNLIYNQFFSKWTWQGRNITCISETLNILFY